MQRDSSRTCSMTRTQTCAVHHAAPERVRSAPSPTQREWGVRITPRPSPTPRRPRRRWCRTRVRAPTPAAARRYHGHGHGRSASGSWRLRRFQTVRPVGTCTSASPPAPAGTSTSDAASESSRALGSAANCSCVLDDHTIPRWRHGEQPRPSTMLPFVYGAPPEVARDDSGRSGVRCWRGRANGTVPEHR